MTASVSLSPTERVLCALLDATCRWITETNPSVEVDGEARAFAALQKPGLGAPGLGCEARIAGGWVRDKLLQQESHDLDVSLSTLTGYTFALFLRAYLDTDAFRTSSLASELAELAGDSQVAMSQIGKIAANPEQSKNLETATARVFGLELDFVNLRKEEYVGTSRIPIMSFGTPLEDALRRDITVNSLFYNVHTGRVEDWTEMGLADMSAGVVRTPMDPVTTFSDDPLRILRCVRFASRFGYTIHEAIWRCLRGEATSGVTQEEAERTAHGLRDHLRTKVSRERFGIEVDKMLHGPDPLRALQLLSDLKLYPVVFLPPNEPNLRYTRPDGTPVDPATLDEHAALRTGALLQDILTQGGRFAVAQRLPRTWLDAVRGDKDTVRLLWFAVALLYVGDTLVPEKKAMVWTGARVVAQGLKLGTKNTKDPLLCFHAAAALLRHPDPARFPRADEPLLSQTSSIGLLLRNPNVTNERLGVELPGVLLYAFLCDLVPLWRGDALDEDAASAVLAEYTAFWELVEAQQLRTAALARPVLDGNQIAETLACHRALLHRIQPYVVAWQLDHRDDPSPEACAAWLRSAWDAGELVPVEERTPGVDKKKRQKQ